MDDVHRQPRDGDRNPVSDRIKRAVADGRIGAADGDIRLANVRSAQSMTELGMIVRDLDQLEAVVQPGQPATGAQTTAGQPWSGVSQAELARDAAVASSKRTVPFLILGLVLALVVAGAVGLVVFATGGEKSGSVSSPTLPDPVSPGAEQTDAASPVADPDGPADPSDPEIDYALTATGLQSFLTGYHAKFGTYRVVDATFYPDYVVVQVPVAGKKRHSGWLFKNGEWSDFGGVSANFPGTEPVDLTKLRIGALLRNIGQARRVLQVEDPSTTYVVINFRPQFDDQPNVNIYLSNEFRESGYLATTLGGKVERAYPFEG